jgi:hypothetical protein
MGSRRGVEAQTPSAIDISNLLEIPPRMVNDQERVCLTFGVEQILKFIASDRGHITVTVRAPRRTIWPTFRAIEIPCDTRHPSETRAIELFRLNMQSACDSYTTVLR